MKTIIAVASLGLAAFGTSGMAQAETAATPVQDVVITATRLTAGLSVTPSAYLIDRIDIDLRQLTFASQALQSVPGLSVFSTGLFGVTSVRQRGAGSDKTLVLIDGIAVNDPSQPQGSFDFANLGLDDVQRIEVLSGPQTSLWGSDAIGGVISITSRDIDGARASLESGSLGTLHGALALGRTTDRGALGITASAIRSDGISAADSRNVYTAYGFPKLHNGEKDGLLDRSFAARARHQLTDAVQIDASVRYDNSKIDIDGYPSATTYVLADTKDAYKSTSYLGQARALIDGPYGLRSEVNFSGYKLDRGATGESGDYGYTAHSTTVRWTISKGGLDDKVSVLAGLERLGNRATLSTGANADRGDSSSFMVVRIRPVSALTITASERYDAYDHMTGVSTGRIAGTVAVGGGLTLQASTGQGFKTPSISEMACDFCYATAVSLRPEFARGHEAGLTWGSPNGRVTAGITAFELNVRDQITYNNLRYINLAHARSRGTESTLQAVLGGGFRLKGAFTRINAIDVTTGKPQLRAPNSVVAATLYWQGSKANVALSLRTQSRQADTDLNGYSPMTRPGYAVTDLAWGYALSDKVSLTARIENLADTTYQQAYGFGAPGRAGYFGLKLKP